MFLRTLFGSRMPQSLYPRANEDISNYWHEDTEFARELARIIQEEEGGEGGVNADQMKLVLPVLVKETIEHDLVSGKNTVALIDAIENRSIGNVPSLNIDEIQNAPINTPLSPSGFISIAAADIDEANADERLSRQLQNGEIDMELIESLHRISFQGLPQPSTEFSQSIINNLFSLLQGRHLRRTAAASVPVVKENSNIEAIDEEKQVERRFLSLLRRINELRSQQYDMDVTGGLPYAQTMSLPTFPYQRRHKIEEEEEANRSSTIVVQENATCAICLMEFEVLDQVRALTCLHIYHQKCIDPWLMESRACPTCKHCVAVY